MKQWFVFYYDDNCDMGGIGLEQFDTQQTALEFIESRMRLKHHDATLSDYTLIEGKSLPLVAVQQITKVAVKDA